MNVIRKSFNFYLRPFLVIQLLNFIFFLVLGSYLEEWEGFFSTAIEGIYTKPAIRGWDTDTHFILLYAYHWLAQWSVKYNVYGFILFFNNWIGLTLLGCVIYRILKVNLPDYSLLIFILLYSLVGVDSLQNLNSTRHAFIFITAILGYIESRRLEQSSISKMGWALISVVILYASLIRFDSVLLFSMIYMVLLVIHKRFVRMAFIPFLISGGIYFTYHLVSDRFSTEEKKVLIYKEREIFDRYNVDYERLSALQKLEADALMQYCITDKEHFTAAFYDAISRIHPPKGILNVLNGFNVHSVLVTWMISKSIFYTARYYYIIYLFSGLFILLNRKQNPGNYFIHYLFLAIAPLFLCFYTVVPLRFLIPFLSFSACLNVLLILKNNDKNRTILWFCLAALGLVFLYSYKNKSTYEIKAKEYNEFAGKLLLLGQKQPADVPLVINSVYPVNYFPVKPFDKLYKQHAVFLNFYLFSADDYQILTWKELCGCNTFSLKERVDYVVEHQNFFLIDDKAFAFLQNYLSMKYGVQLGQKDIHDFDKNLRVCKLCYVPENK